MSLRQTRGTLNQATHDRVRPELCTCGARLAENARFCHLCGRPVFGPEIPESAPPAALPQMAFAQAAASPLSHGGLAQLPVGFRNPIALRVAFLMSLGVMLMTIVQILLSPVWWLVAGLCAVLLYRRLTGLSLSVGAGARLGSITGVLAFLSLVIIIGVMLALKGNDAFQEVLKQNPSASQALNDPSSVVIASLFVLVFLFAIVVGTCAAGGALGARFASRNAKI